MVYRRRYRRYPRRYRRKSYRRPRRMTRRRSRYAWGSRKRYGLTKVGFRGLGLPQRLTMNMKHTYSTGDLAFSPGVNAFSNLSASGFRFYGNCCAPAYVGGSATVSRDCAHPFPDMWAFYGRAYIPYCTIRVTLSNNTSVGVRCTQLASPSVGELTPTDITEYEGLSERTRSKSITLGAAGGSGAVKTLTMKMSTKAVQSETLAPFESLMFTESSVPSQPWYWNTCIWTLDRTTVPDVDVSVSVVYHVVLMNKLQYFDTAAAAAAESTIPSSLPPPEAPAPTEEDKDIVIAKLMAQIESLKSPT